MAETAEDEFDVTVVSRGTDGELQHTTVHIHFILNTVHIGQETVHSSHIRYLTTKTGPLATADNIILLSYHKPDADNSNMMTKYCYFQELNPLKAGKFLNRFRHFQFSYVKHLPQSEAKMEVIDYFVPKFACCMDIKVTCSPSGANVLLQSDSSEEEEKSYIVTLDEECFSLFEQEYDTEPVHQVNFWKEPGPNVMEKVVLNHTTERMEIDTALHQYSVDARPPNVQEFFNKMKTIEPKPKTRVLDPVAMVKHRQIFTRYQWPAFQVGQHGYQEEQEIQNSRDTDTALMESAQFYLKHFKESLEEAYQQGNSNPDWQSLWQPNDEQIQVLLEANLIPDKDARSGGLDPDSVDHFQQSMEDIDDKLFSQDLEGAICSLRSVRTIFSESRYREMRPILADDDYTLLKKLFFKALSGQPI